MMGLRILEIVLKVKIDLLKNPLLRVHWCHENESSGFFRLFVVVVVLWSHFSRKFEK